MKKRFFAFFCALLMLMSLSCGVSALITIEDETGIRYSTDEVETTKQPSAASVAVKKAMESVSGFWRRFGVLTVVILLLAAIVIAIVISEAERQKKSRPPKPASKKRKNK